VAGVPSATLLADVGPQSTSARDRSSLVHPKILNLMTWLIFRPPARDSPAPLCLRELETFSDESKSFPFYIHRCRRQRQHQSIEHAFQHESLSIRVSRT